MNRRLNLPTILAVILILSSCGDPQKPPAPPPPEVSVYVVRSSEVPVYKEYVGQTLGHRDIDMVARVPGYLEGIHFREGSEVKAGDLLYTIENQQYRASVAEKKSKLAEQKILLANAGRDLSRYEPLVEENAVSQMEYDSAKARYEAAISSVEAAEANLEASEIKLGYTKIHSPIDGIIGRTRAKIGDFVGATPAGSVLNTVSSVDPILVQFSITEREYLHFVRNMRAPEGKKTESPELRLTLADNSVYEHPGRADFIDRSVDASTGTILVQASFPNPDHLLRPGQFSRVRAEVEKEKDATLIPQRCVTEIQGTFSVYVVDADNRVSARRVETGPTVGSFWLIRSGLEPGEKVIYEGIQFVGEGAVVKPVTVEVEQPGAESAT